MKTRPPRSKAGVSGFEALCWGGLHERGPASLLRHLLLQAPFRVVQQVHDQPGACPAQGVTRFAASENATGVASEGHARRT